MESCLEMIDSTTGKFVTVKAGNLLSNGCQFIVYVIKIA